MASKSEPAQECTLSFVSGTSLVLEDELFEKEVEERKRFSLLRTARIAGSKLFSKLCYCPRRLIAKLKWRKGKPATSFNESELSTSKKQRPAVWSKVYHRKSGWFWTSTRLSSIHQRLQWASMTCISNTNVQRQAKKSMFFLVSGPSPATSWTICLNTMISLSSLQESNK